MLMPCWLVASVEVVSMRCVAALCFLLTFGLLGAGGAAAQQAPYVVDGTSDALIRVDPATGDRTVVSGCADATCTTLVGTGAALAFPRAIFFESSTQVLVGNGDLDDLNNIQTLFRVDIATGDRTVVSSSLAGSEVGTGPISDLDTIFDVILDANGDILIADTQIDTIFRVDPVTGDRTVLSSNTVGTGPTMSFPGDMVLEADGNIVITEGSNDQVLRVDPVTGNRTIVSSSLVGTPVGTGIDFANLGGITLTADGTILVVDEGAQAVISVDPSTGDRVEVSGPLVGTGPALVNTYSVNVDATGTIFVANGSLGLMQIDPLTGDRVVLSSSDGTNSVGSGIPTPNLRDVRVEPLTAPPIVPSGSPLTFVLLGLLLLGTAVVLLARRPQLTS